MVTPTKLQTLQRARHIELEDIIGKGLPAITPEDYELKESGAFHKAKRQLMCGQKLEMRKYLDQMAAEIGLSIISKRDLKELEKTSKKSPIKVEPNGNSLLYLAHALKPWKRQPQKKKSHITRSSKSMRVLRKINRVKVFAFPDDVWKVRRKKR